MQGGRTNKRKVVTQASVLQGGRTDKREVVSQGNKRKTKY